MAGCHPRHFSSACCCHCYCGIQTRFIKISDWISFHTLQNPENTSTMSTTLLTAVNAKSAVMTPSVQLGFNGAAFTTNPSAEQERQWIEQVKTGSHQLKTDHPKYISPSNLFSLKRLTFIRMMTELNMSFIIWSEKIRWMKI